MSFSLTHRVLVVDDYRESARALAQLLDVFGFETYLAHDGASAIAQAATLAPPPDVVILDLMLPDLDGYEVARQLRALPAAHEALLIALTGYPVDQGPRRAEASLFDYFLMKPVSPVMLRDVLVSMLAAPTLAAP